ncbi:MAG: S8 family serine peptidase [candidate division WOR-3 bacterium]|nr:S8 family serine peptidase [candidate division WOR-3 bacterium]
MLTFLLLVGVMYDYQAPLQNKVDPRCYTDAHVRAWVYFTDKNITVEDYDAAIRVVRTQLTDAARQRRALRRGVTDYADIPVYEDYIAEVEANGGLLITCSKWLNAASFLIAIEDIDQIAQLDFVHKITRVAPFRAPLEAEATVQDTAIYGLTYRQSQMFGIERIHDMGIFGSNVRVGFLDTGLRRTHIAVNNVNVIAEYDFLGGDQIWMNNMPITPKYGTFSDLIFRRTSSRYNLFLSGDTLQYNDPVRDLLYTYSTDNGQTWSPNLIKLTNYYNNWVVELDACGGDTMFVFYRDRYGLKYLVHTDTILVQSMPLGDPPRREPSSIRVGDTVYVAYHSKDSDSDTTFLLLKRGTISGFPQESVIESSPMNIRAPKMVTGNSAIGIFYHVSPTNTLYFTKSAIPPTTFNQTFTTTGKDAEAITAGDTIYAIWKDTSNDPLFRVLFARSEDFGETFTTHLFLTPEINAIGKISLARTSNTLTVTWESAGRIYSRTSNDNGTTFGGIDSMSTLFAYLPTLAAPEAQIVRFSSVRGDSITDGYSVTDPDYYYPRHGTEMLALVGGYFSGRYIGVAPGAQFIVAKTENPDTSYEFPVEEDTYIAGLEWCEAQGADIVSSSLGYADWYAWPRDFDGKTSPASIAAYEATKRGLLVVTAAGNVSVPRIEIPGDAMNVITVGGIDSLYNRWQYSGYGPTFDGRMKPEIMCLSAAPVVINPDSTDSYLYSFGTSGATAMITGICALLLEAHPNWTVDSVQTALYSTASFADTPSDSMGYGWPDAYAAITHSPIQVDSVGGSGWLTPYPNPFLLSQHDNIYMPFRLDRESLVEFKVYSMSGRLVRKEERSGLLLPGSYTGESAFVWDGTDEDGKDVGSGLYYCLLITHGAGNDVVKIAVVK